MTLFLILVTIAVGTYAMRASFILLLAGRTIPPALSGAMRSVGPAVLAALTGSIIVGEEGIRGLDPRPEIIAFAVAALAAWRTKNIVATLVSGMAALWLLQAAGL